MAKAKKIEAEVRYELVLTSEEAEVLLFITRQIGGYSKTTRRGVTDAICHALRGAGVEDKSFACYSSSIEFKE